MAVRNFWITVDIDGRATVFSGGPRSKDGGFDMVIKQRSNGKIIIAAKIQGYATEDGKLRLRIDVPKGQIIETETER